MIDREVRINAFRPTTARPPALLLAAFCLAVLAGGGLPGIASTRLQAAEDDEIRSGRLLDLQGAATRAFYGELKRGLEELQQRAEEESRDAYLVLELHKGPSTLGQVSDVVDLLLSAEYPRVKTVTWIPEGERVSGYNTLIALATHSIVMHSDSSLGDVGEGRAVDERVRTLVTTVVRARRNPLLNDAIAQSMLDEQVALLKLTVRRTRDGRKVTETEFVTQEGLRELRNDNTIEIPDQPATLKEAGATGVFSGSKMADDRFLIDRTARDLPDLESYLKVRLGRSAVHDRVALIKVDGELTQVLESFITRQIDRSVREEKNLIIFELNCTGGRMKPAVALSQRILELDESILTVAYVRSEAYSTAAIVALSCDEIYMAADARLGEAVPAEIEEGNRGPLREHLKEIADQTNRPQGLLLAMADKETVAYRVTHPDGRAGFLTEDELADDRDGWVKGAAVPESKAGQLMTVTGERAVQLRLATNLVDGKSRDDQLRDLKSKLHLDPDMRLAVLQPTWVDSLVFWLNNEYVTVFLLVAAIVCLYLETHIMSGFLGLLAVLCFALFFWAKFLGGTAGWLEVILFLLGAACIAIEIFLIPGFGVFGISGGLMMIVSLVLASQTFGNLEPNADYRLLAGTMGRLAVSILLVVVIAVALSRYLPNVPLFGQMVLTPPGYSVDPDGAGPKLRPDVLDERASLVGSAGEAASVLRPSGKAEIDGKMYDVVSEGPYIPAGSKIKVVAVSGNRIVVREA